MLKYAENNLPKDFSYAVDGNGGDVIEQNSRFQKLGKMLIIDCLSPV